MHAITALTYVLPHRLLSSLARRLAYSTNPRTKQWLIDTVVRKFDVDLGEALEPDATRYPTFNAFFTRALRPSARVPDAEPDAEVPDAEAATAAASAGGSRCAVAGRRGPGRGPAGRRGCARGRARCRARSGRRGARRGGARGQA